MMMEKEIRQQMREAQEQIRLSRLLAKEAIEAERARLQILRAQHLKLTGTHTAHPKGSEHHLSKSWNLWKRVAPNEYEFMGKYGSIGEIARELGKSYMATWGMMRRWQKISSGAEEYKYKTAKFKGLQYRIEEA
jgi:hypothetical protein